MHISQHSDEPVLRPASKKRMIPPQPISKDLMNLSKDSIKYNAYVNGATLESVKPLVELWKAPSQRLRPQIDPQYDYAIEIELDRMAKASVPKGQFQPRKNKSFMTEEMIEKYKRNEERQIRERGTIAPPDTLELEDLEDFDSEGFAHDLSILQSRKSALLREYQTVETDVDTLRRRVEARPELREEPRIILQFTKYKLKQLALQNEMRTIEEDLARQKDEYAQVQGINQSIKKRNAQTIKNYEDQFRLLNRDLPIQQMIGETDEEYRARLLAFKQEVSTDAEAEEARTYEHKVFKRNLKKLIDLPQHEVENLVKSLDGLMATEKGMEPAERTFQLNEIWPRITSQFTRVYGINPLFRNPVETLYTFFVDLLERPQMEDVPEAIAYSGIATAEDKARISLKKRVDEAIRAGVIDARLKDKSTVQMDKLLKDAGVESSRSKRDIYTKKVLLTSYMRDSGNDVLEVFEEVE